MSGGSHDYLYYKVEEFAGSIAPRPVSARRQEFAKLLDLVAKAMHDIEWVDSGDYSPGDEDAALDTVFAWSANIASLDTPPEG